MANDFDKFIDKAFKKIEKQIIFAAAIAATEIAKDVKVGIERQAKADIDRPTRFTMNAFKVNRADKKTLTSSVEIRPLQAKYLALQIKGGTVRNKTVIIPRKKAQNSYGNLAKGKLKRLSDQGKTYKSHGLVIQKMKTKSKGIAYITDHATYTKRFKFFERGHLTAKAVASKHVKKAIRYALSTAR